jgi:exopolysaccharide biosynthesis polyprenyl glycosylphosphotransferase
MNATERTALSQGLALYDEMSAAVDDRTLEILDRRRKTAVIRRRGWLVRRTLLLADLAGLLLGFAIAQALFGLGAWEQDPVGFRAEILLFLLTLPGWIVVAKLYGLYDRDEERTDHSTVDEVIGVFHLVTVGSWLFLAGAWLTGLADPSFPKLLTFWALAIVVVSLGRATARALCRRSITYLQNTVIVGAGDVGQLIAKKVLQHPEYGLNVVGFLDASPKERRDDLEHLTILGGPERLPGVVRMLDVERVVIAFSGDSHEETLDFIRSMKDLDVQVDVVPRFFETVGSNASVHTVEGVPVIGLPPLRLSPSSRFLKRTIDIALSLAALVVLAPAFVLVAVLIKLDSRGPVFFRQVRMGAGDRTFHILKFRTMVADADAHREELRREVAGNGREPVLFKLENDPRLTKLGRRLRRWSIDEAPQLINVLRGEMSLVGPRPLPLDEDENVADWQRRRLDLKPGITGLWQVLGRSDIPFEEMLKLDYLYVTSWSLLSDLKLIVRTVPVLLRGHGAY